MHNFRVTITKDNLFKSLRENREKHHAIFLEALEGYQKRVIEMLEEQLRYARERKRFVPSVSIRQPVDHTDDYDRMVAMLELSEDEEFELDENEFNSYVRDDWGWKQDFLVTNTAYSQSAAEESAKWRKL